jgi:SAM-dependent methyltransferase
VAGNGDRVSREELSRAEFAAAVRDHMNTELVDSSHHPGAEYTPSAFRHYIRRRALLGCLAGLEFSSALDVGCAEGYFMGAIGRRFGTGIWGVDISDACVASVHRNLGFPAAAADATKLPLPDSSVDLVYSTEVIEHVLDPDQMIAEMRRVARRWVVVTTPVSQTDHDHAPDFELADEGHVNNFDRATVKRLFGDEAKLGRFRCNLTLALIVAGGRFLPRRGRDFFYDLDYRVSQRFGDPSHRFKPLRNRDWLIVVPATPGEDSDPEWRCPADRGRLTADGDSLRCEICGTRYRTRDEVPDFAPAEQS